MRIVEVCCVLIFLICATNCVVVLDKVEGNWDLPLTPDIRDANVANSTIPFQAWIKLRTKEARNEQNLQEIVRNNQDFEFNFMDDESMDAFMDKNFKNTSTLWAYKSVNPVLIAAKVDIWRIAALWLYGGVYIDDDSALSGKLHDIIEKNDQFIFGVEKNKYGGCYDPSYPLNSTGKALQTSSDGQMIVNWFLLSRPRHPFLENNLKNIVQVFKDIKNGKAVINKGWFLPKVICATGPGILSASVDQVISRDGNIKFRNAGVDFSKYGAKWMSNNYRKKGNNPRHYSNLEKNGAGLVLKSDI